MPTKVTCEYQDGDDKWLREFEHEIEMLTGMVEEAFVENKVYLLSPVMREMMANKGQKVRKMLDRVRAYLYVDNLGEPLATKGANS